MIQSNLRQSKIKFRAKCCPWSMPANQQEKAPLKNHINPLRSRIKHYLIPTFPSIAMCSFQLNPRCNQERDLNPTRQYGNANMKKTFHLLAYVTFHPPSKMTTITYPWWRDIMTRLFVSPTKWQMRIMWFFTFSTQWPFAFRHSDPSAFWAQWLSCMKCQSSNRWITCLH